MKKIFGAFLALILMLGLVACGQKNVVTNETWQEQYDLGVRYLSEGNYEEAVIAFAAAIEIDPKRVEAYISLAESYALQGSWENVKEILLIAKEKSGESDKLASAWEELLEQDASAMESDYTTSEYKHEFEDGSYDVTKWDEKGRIIEYEYCYDPEQFREKFTYAYSGERVVITYYVFRHGEPFGGSTTYLMAEAENEVDLCRISTQTAEVDVVEYDTNGDEVARIQVILE